MPGAAPRTSTRADSAVSRAEHDRAAGHAALVGGVADGDARHVADRAVGAWRLAIDRHRHGTPERSLSARGRPVPPNDACRVVRQPGWRVQSIVMTTSTPLNLAPADRSSALAEPPRSDPGLSGLPPGRLHLRRPAVRHPWTSRQTDDAGRAGAGRPDRRLRFHFAGPGGKLIGQWMAAAGFEDADWRDRCYITSMTRCFPGKAPKGSGDRRPSPAELRLCQPFLEAELRLVQPRLILAVGTMAIDYFLGKRSLEAVVGSIEEADGRPVLALPHPSPVSRWLNDPVHRLLVDRAIDLLSRSRQDLDL